VQRIVPETEEISNYAMLEVMRKMGIDYGTKNVGIALSDDQGLMAFPHKVLKNDKDFKKNLFTMIDEMKVSEIIIGHSLGRDGEPNKVHQAVEELITDITLENGLPVHLEPEQYTTQEAIRFQGKNKDTDASAAAIILNSYIIRHS